MTSSIVPIRDNIEPGIDAERELIDWCLTRLRTFREDAGVPPEQIAIVLIGLDRNDEMYSLANSWDVYSRRTRLETCSMAATLLTARAMGQ